METLGCLEVFKSSSIQISDERIEASQFSIAILDRETSAQIGEGLTCVSCMRGGNFWQFGLIASLATETTGGEILVAFLAQTWTQK